MYSGWSNQYQGVALASACDVVFISINYRLGAFGKALLLYGLSPSPPCAPRGVSHCLEQQVSDRGSLIYPESSCINQTLGWDHLGSARN